MNRCCFWANKKHSVLWGVRLIWVQIVIKCYFDHVFRKIFHICNFDKFVRSSSFSFGMMTTLRLKLIATAWCLIISWTSQSTPLYRKYTVRGCLRCFIASTISTLQKVSHIPNRTKAHLIRCSTSRWRKPLVLKN